MQNYEKEFNNIIKNKQIILIESKELNGIFFLLIPLILEEQKKNILFVLELFQPTKIFYNNCLIFLKEILIIIYELSTNIIKKFSNKRTFSQMEILEKVNIELHDSLYFSQQVFNNLLCCLPEISSKKKKLKQKFYYILSYCSK